MERADSSFCRTLSTMKWVGLMFLFFCGKFIILARIAAKEYDGTLALLQLIMIKVDES